MAYNETLAAKVRKALKDVGNVEERKMFRGLTFMVNDKMCISVSGDELMCRFDASLQQKVMERNGVRKMIMRGKTMDGFVYVNEEGYKHQEDFDYWIKLCLDYNPRAKSSKTTKRKK